MRHKKLLLGMLSVFLCLVQACNKKAPNQEGIYSITYYESTDYVLSGPSQAKEGTEVTFNIDNIKEGFAVDYFLVNNEKTQSNSFIMPKFNTLVEAILAPSDNREYPIYFAESELGSIASNMEYAKAGTEVPLFIKANDGYRLNKLKANDVYLTIKDNEKQNYYAHVIMQNKPLYVEAEFVKTEKLFDEYEFSLRGSGVNSAQSFWQFEYKEEGFEVRVCVIDSTIIDNASLNVWERDDVELQMCMETASNRPSDTKVFRCLMACDGRYYLQRLRSDGAYYALGRNIDYQYGKNFVNEAVICKPAVNGFSGYIVKALFGYDLFETDYEHALGHITFAPALRDSTSYNQSTKKLDSTWYSTSITMAQSYMNTYMNSAYHCTWFNPRSYLRVNANGTVSDRYLTLDTDLLFMGDSYTITSRYGSMYDDFADLKVSTIGFGASKTTDWVSGTKCLNLVNTIQPRNIALHIGGNDLYVTSPNLENTINNLKSMINTIIHDVPTVKIYLMTLVHRQVHTSSEEMTMINTFNSTITSFYSGNPNVVVCNITDDFLGEDGLPIPGMFTDKTHATSLGYAYISNVIRSAMNLPLLSDSALFGSYGKCYATNGFTYENDGESSYLRQRNSMSKFGDRYVYFKKNANNDFVTSAYFNVSESYNGDTYPKFGILLNDSENQLFFYIDTNDYFERKWVGVSSRINGTYNWNYIAPETYNVFFTNDDYTKLSIVRESGVLSFFVNDYKIGEISPTYLKESYDVGFFSFNLALNVKNPSLEVEAI